MGYSQFFSLFFCCYPKFLVTNHSNKEYSDKGTQWPSTDDRNPNLFKKVFSKKNKGHCEPDP